MKLHVKLIIAFSIMLILVGCTALSGWLSMHDMARMADQTTFVNDALTSIQNARTNELRYLYFKDKKYAQEVATELDKAHSLITKAEEYIRMPAQKKRAEATLQDIRNFGQGFMGLVEATDKAAAVTANMVALNDEISAATGKSLDILENSILTSYTEQDFKAFYLVNQADSNFYLSRVYTRRYMSEPTKESADGASRELAKTRALCVEAEKMLTTPADKAIVQGIIKLLDSYALRVREFVSLSEGVTNQIAKVRDQASKVVTQCDDMTQAATELMVISQANGSRNNMIAVLLSILVGIGITLGLTKNVTRQLGKDPGDLAAIATRVTNGDYNIDDGSPLVGVYSNIVGMVTALKENIETAHKAMEQAKQESARATEAMKEADAASKDAQARRDSILLAADKLDQVAHVVSSASEELSAQIEQSERGAAEQAARVGETATAMEEMNSTVLEVARNAASANNGGNSMRVKALEGASIVDSSVSGVQKARADALALKEDMNALSEQAQSIGQIMNVISDIADQTNLLALNAAIEAARAGEAGRGFAVVADEVRKLAEKTMQSTTDVGNAIKSIQASADKNMAQVDATVKNIEESTAQAEKSGQALREIVEMIDISVAQVSSIATASEEQSATSEQINHSIAEVNTIATETARAMQEAAQAVSELSQQAQVLARLITDMKKD